MTLTTGKFLNRKGCIMKKFLATLFILFNLLVLSSCHHHHEVKPATTPHMTWHIEKRNLQEMNSKPFYKINVSYPEVVGNIPNRSTENINKMIQNFIGKQIIAFKENIPKDTTYLKDFPTSMRKNELI